MAIFEQIPYTNLHNMNLDWIVARMKECVSAVEELTADVTELQTAVGALNTLTDEISSRLSAVEVVAEEGKETADEAAETAGEALTLASYASSQLLNKVDMRTDAGSEVYAHEGDEQTGITIGDSANNIPRRNSGGSIFVPSPLNASDAAPKSYVDSKQTLYKMLSEAEEIDDTYSYTADGVWTLAYAGIFRTTITMTNRPSLALSNVIRIIIDGETLVFTRTDATDSYSYACNNPDFDLSLTAPAGNISVITVTQYANSQPSTSTISNIGFSFGYAPVADLALKSEAEELIFVLDDDTVVRKKVVMVDD